MFLTLDSWIIAAPIAFVVGAVVGWGVTSRWLIIRRETLEQLRERKRS